jgi:DNA-binding NarL/FixJ family response regulator
VLLVDDHPFMREGLRGRLEMEKDIVVCAEAGTAAEAMKVVEREERLQAVITDLSLPGTCGLDLIRDIKLCRPALPVLVLSMHDERIYAERALRAGARGYIMKQERPELLITGLRAVLRGEMFVSPEMASTLLHTFVNGAPRAGDRVGVERLSNREIQVFEAIGGGLSTREISERLHLSAKTIETYRMHIKRKLGLASGHSLMHAAIHWVTGGETRPDAPAGPVKRGRPRKRAAV